MEADFSPHGKGMGFQHNFHPPPPRQKHGVQEFEKEGKAGGRKDGGEDGGRKGRGLGGNDSVSPGEVQAVFAATS